MEAGIIEGDDGKYTAKTANHKEGESASWL
jgi:hypothetical protein